MKPFALLARLLWLSAGFPLAHAASAANAKILPDDWDPKSAADKVLAGLINTSAPQVRGAHDAEMALVNGRAYIVSESNDV